MENPSRTSVERVNLWKRSLPYKAKILPSVRQTNKNDGDEVQELKNTETKYNLNSLDHESVKELYKKNVSTKNVYREALPAQMNSIIISRSA